MPLLDFGAGKIETGPSTLYILISARERRFKIGVSDTLSRRVSHLERVSGPIDWIRSFAIQFNRASLPVKLEKILHRTFFPYHSPLPDNVDGFSEWFHEECLQRVQDTIQQVIDIWTKDPKITVHRLGLDRPLPHSLINRAKLPAQSVDLVAASPRIFKNADRLASVMPAWLNLLSKIGPDVLCINANLSHRIVGDNIPTPNFSLAIVVQGKSEALSSFLEIQFGTMHVFQTSSPTPLTFVYFTGPCAEEMKSLSQFQAPWRMTINALSSQLRPAPPAMLESALLAIKSQEPDTTDVDPLWDETETGFFAIDGARIWMDALTDRLHPIKTKVETLAV